MSIADIPPSETRRLAREILSRSKYSQWRTIEWEALSRWFKEHFEWLLAFLSGTAAVSPAVYIVFWGVLGLITLLLAVHVIWTVRAALKLQPPHDSSMPSQASVDLDAAAGALAGQGKFLEASHCLYLASLDLLMRRGWLELSRADANRVLRRRVRLSPLSRPHAEEFCRLLDRTESAWFRSRGEEPSLYEDWRRLLNGIRLEAEVVPLR